MKKQCVSTKIGVLLSILFVLGFGCSHAPSKQAVNAGAQAESVKLNKIIADYTEQQKHLDPYYAFYFNLDDDLAKFGDYLSEDFLKREKEIEKEALDKLQFVDSKQLAGEDLTTYKLFHSRVDLNLRSFMFPTEELSFNQMESRLSNFIDLANPSLTGFPFDSAKHYHDFIKRSEGFPDYVENQIAVMRRGIHDKVTLSCIVAKKARSSYVTALESKIEKNPFWKPIGIMPTTFTPDEVKEIKEGFKHVISERILPAYKKFDRFYTTEYMPHCNPGFGILAQPGGEAWYEYAIEEGTTLKMKAEDLHQLGLQEVERLSKDMVDVLQQMGMTGPMAANLRKVSKDPKYQFKSAKEMMAAFADVKERVNKVIPQYFSLIPQSDYEIVEATNPESAAGEYSDPTEMRPTGRFIVNDKNLKLVSRLGATALSLHEAVPGHHFQLALQFEMKNQLSEYRRKLFSANSFVEGWAHYAEYLGVEMGMYPDNVQKLGYLGDQMLRAVRLVVDTGIHHYNWTQSHAIQYMTDHLADDRRSIEIEVNRYSVWPGQALGYKVGQLKILELRRWAEKQLGPRFDIKDFHRAVIGNGTVSLPVLEEQVRAWVATVAAKGA